MKDFFSLLQKHPQFKEIVRCLRGGINCSVAGLWGSSANFFLATIAKNQGKTVDYWPKILLVVSHIEEADEDREDLNTFFHGTVGLFPAIETIFPVDSEDEDDIPARRLYLLNKLLENNRHTKNTLDIVVAPVQALLQPVPSPQAISENFISLRRNQECSQEKLIVWLQEHQYRQVYQVENPGEYALRGGIIDIFPHAEDTPCRIEYFGDEIESIRKFNLETQLSEEDLEVCRILSVCTIQKNITMYTDTGKISLIDYLHGKTWIVMKELVNIESRAKKFLDTIDDETRFLSFQSLLKKMTSFPHITLSKLPVASNKHGYAFQVKSVDNFPRQVPAIMQELKSVIESNTNTIVFCNNAAEKQRFQEMLCDLSVAEKKRLELRIGYIHRGFQFSDIQLAFLAHHEIFQRYRQRHETKKTIQTRAIDSFLDLKKGDYVVHVSHGIGRFRGMEMLEEGGYKKEYLVLEFYEGTKIYVSVTNIELVQKYIGGSEHRPRLDKINASSWEARKKRTANAVIDVAGDLLRIQALRNAKAGIAYPKDTEWQGEFESAFPYEETPDQLQVMKNIKNDMETKRPMDRLVCGDVGYGKTELAMRAAFKAVMHGKQVAVLVPTTILAQQHYTTFSERMADYPVSVEVLSRLKTRKEQKDIIERASSGVADILIGTHRLLQKDVSFKDLGLIIIDEEQRFGVAHKERFKKLRQVVDILTLTATPIPRTLHMSLMGIKDISSLNTPPLGRQAIHTQIIRFDPEHIRKAIRLELNRDGQVYFVHNRVYNIERIARILSDIVPEATTITIHGQMDVKLMEHRMREFVLGKADILVSTTIIESGLDIPNVNTIFINNADTFGLADLHQLRGRVGRYKHHAYAYIILPVDRPITPEAEKRVKAIKEFAELGAGFRIAMRDLEIRGAGNIIGTEQHGHIAAVGYEMYCRLLARAVKKVRNEPVHEPLEVSIDINLESFIPDSYIPDEGLKIDIYRRLNRSTTFEEIKALNGEITDRFGTLPPQVKNLLSLGELRVIAQQIRIRSIVRSNSILIFHGEDLRKSERYFSHLKKYIRVINADTLHVRLPKKDMRAEVLLDFLKRSIQVKNN
ncbi:MAG: transcription-repair coupling factor [Candidatus Brocadiaceae bacterium]|nr:transcription-repair coupling factor [Candidatus Brocadiaceae bacterium]